MPIRRLLDSNTFDSKEAARITAAFNEVLQRLDIKRGAEPYREEQIASRVIAIAKRGPIDESRIVAAALRELAQ
jgi:hypothetical protein